VALHPLRRLAELPGVVVEGRTDRHDREVEVWPHGVREHLLARAAEADQQQARARVGDPARDLLGLTGQGGAEL
jgi:hypothetical protein